MRDGVESDPWVGAPPRAGMPRAIVWALGGCLLLLFLAGTAFVVFFAFVGSSPTPGTNAEAESEIAPAVLADMRADGLIEPDERVLYLYSGALFHVRDGAAFFTDRRVVAIPGTFEERAGERISARYDEIADVEFIPATEVLDDSVVRIVRSDGSEFELLVGRGAGGDVKFERALRKEWHARGGAGRGDYDDPNASGPPAPIERFEIEGSLPEPDDDEH